MKTNLKKKRIYTAIVTGQTQKCCRGTVGNLLLTETRGARVFLSVFNNNIVHVVYLNLWSNQFSAHV